MIELLLARLACATEVTEIVVATSTDASNQPLAEHVLALGYRCFRGSENDVLDRYFQAAKASAAGLGLCFFMSRTINQTYKMLNGFLLTF